MTHSFIFCTLFKVNDAYIAASNIDEAISIYREYDPDEEIVKASRYSGILDTALCKIATPADIVDSFGPEKS